VQEYEQKRLLQILDIKKIKFFYQRHYMPRNAWNDLWKNRVKDADGPLQDDVPCCSGFETRSFENAIQENTKEI
jgi:hypothetical protein